MNYEDLIEKYIQNKLSLEEKSIFEELLKKDIAFKEEVENLTNLNKVIEEVEDSNFKDLISDIESKAKRPGKNYFFNKWLVAASVILVFGLTFFLNLGTNRSTEDLFENYFKPYRNIIRPIERNSDDLDETALAFVAYEKGEYSKAIDGFIKLYEQTNEPYFLFYKANALLKLNKTKEAVPLLLEHLKTKDTLTEKSNWYLALAYLELKDTKNAKKLLKTVVDNGEYKRKEAKKLLREID